MKIIQPDSRIDAKRNIVILDRITDLARDDHATDRNDENIIRA